jgi:catechol 2,3-dioxygenase
VRARVADYGIRPPGFRLPDATRLGAVRLQVADLARSLEYYQHVLGLRSGWRESHAAALGPHDGDVVLVRLQARSGARPVPARGVLGLYHFAILLPDRPALGRFLSHITAIGVPVGTADHAVSEAIYLTDPDGLGIEVYADRPRSSWRHHARQLYMTTEPLDIRSVIAAGGGTRWTGMPAGTVMGHVHLHVGNLDRAEAFYHRALGLDKVVWDYPGALFMSAGGYHHHLGTNTWSPGQPAADDQARLLSWELIVPTSAAAAAAAQSVAAGYEVAQIEGGWTARDPWGTTVRVGAWMAADESRHADSRGA